MNFHMGFKLVAGNLMHTGFSLTFFEQGQLCCLKDSIKTNRQGNILLALSTEIGNNVHFSCGLMQKSLMIEGNDGNKYMKPTSQRYLIRIL